MESASIVVAVLLFHGAQIVCHAAVAIAAWRIANTLKASDGHPTVQLELDSN